jgi:hypothetical protein
MERGQPRRRLATLDRLYAMAAKDHPGAEAGFSAPARRVASGLTTLNY